MGLLGGVGGVLLHVNYLTPCDLYSAQTPEVTHRRHTPQHPLAPPAGPARPELRNRLAPVPPPRRRRGRGHLERAACLSCAVKWCCVPPRCPTTAVSGGTRDGTRPRPRCLLGHTHSTCPHQTPFIAKPSLGIRNTCYHVLLLARIAQPA